MRLVAENLLELRDIIIFTSSTMMAQCRATALNPAVTCSGERHVIFSCQITEENLWKNAGNNMCFFFILMLALCKIPAL